MVITLQNNTFPFSTFSSTAGNWFVLPNCFNSSNAILSPQILLSYYTKQLMENYDILNKNRCQETLTPTSSPSTYLHSRSSSLFQRLYSNERRYLYISCLLLPCRSLRIGSYQRRGRSLSS